MDWSNELIFEFLDLYEKEPVIWNPSHSSHKHRNDVYDGWKRIQQNLSVPMSLQDLKRKKDSLMASYRTCIHKIKQSEGESYKPNWFAFEKMSSFLKKRTEEPLDPLKLENEDYTRNSEAFNSEDSFGMTENCIDDKSKIFKLTDKKHKIERENICSKVPRRSNTRDVCEVYGELIAIKLAEMDEDLRDLAMNRIDNLLFELKHASNLNRKL